MDVKIFVTVETATYREVIEFDNPAVAGAFCQLFTINPIQRAALKITSLQMAFSNEDGPSRLFSEWKLQAIAPAPGGGLNLGGLR